jgi:hypothetical protein
MEDSSGHSEQGQVPSLLIKLLDLLKSAIVICFRPQENGVSADGLETAAQEGLTELVKLSLETLDDLIDVVEVEVE